MISSLCQPLSTSLRTDDCPFTIKNANTILRSIGGENHWHISLPIQRNYQQLYYVSIVSLPAIIPLERIAKLLTQS